MPPRREQKSFLSLQNLQQIEELRQQFFSFLVDAGFVNITNAERRELTSTRYGKSRTKFLRVPSELDTASRDPRTVMACLAASMYPKLLVIDPQNGSLRTLANSAPAAIHPSSVNFGAGRRVDFGQGTRFAAFFQAMHTKKLCAYDFSLLAPRCTLTNCSADVWESGSVDERAVYLLCGNADFQVRPICLGVRSLAHIATLYSFPHTRSRSTARSARALRTPRRRSRSRSCARSGRSSSTGRCATRPRRSIRNTSSGSRCCSRRSRVRSGRTTRRRSGRGRRRSPSSCRSRGTGSSSLRTLRIFCRSSRARCMNRPALHSLATLFAVQTFAATRFPRLASTGTCSWSTCDD